MYDIRLDSPLNSEEENVLKRGKKAMNELASIESENIRSADDVISLDAPSLSRWMSSPSVVYTPQEWSPITSVQPKSSSSDSASSPVSGLSSLPSVEPPKNVPESFSG